MLKNFHNLFALVRISFASFTFVARKVDPPNFYKNKYFRKISTSIRMIYNHQLFMPFINLFLRGSLR